MLQERPDILYGPATGLTCMPTGFFKSFLAKLFVQAKKAKSGLNAGCVNDFETVCLELA